MSSKLLSQAEASLLLVDVFGADLEGELVVWEDRCFPLGKPLSLGVIRLHPDRPEERLDAIKLGQFEWLTPAAAATAEALVGLVDEQLQVQTGKAVQKGAQTALERAQRVLDAIANTAVRCGLTHPRFDARSVEEMPFRRPTTVVSDTSGVIQGGLDFVARFLQPAARIKIPAIVHMEVINHAENYLKRRRSNKSANIATVLDHLLSQGGQRTLLQLEMRSDTEIERTPLLGDPLRNAFLQDKEPGVAELNLSVVLRSYSDRLIVEAARQHQAQMNPGHPLVLLASDQGLARMALSEGITPLFFDAVRADDFFDSTFTGVGLNPFSGQLYNVSLAALLWELATGFGSASIRSRDGLREVRVTALGEGSTWAPFHSRSDLLWVGVGQGDAGPKRPALAATISPTVQPESIAVKVEAAPAGVAPVAPVELAEPGVERQAYYRLNPQSLFRLVSRLADAGRVAESAALRVIEVKNSRSLLEFRRFLVAGDFLKIDPNNGDWLSTERTTRLDAALKAADFREATELLKAVPSVRMLLRSLEAHGRVDDLADVGVPERSVSTYEVLAEITLNLASIPGEGKFSTNANPPAEEFAKLALLRYDALSAGERWVSVGAWLEALVRHDHIHPVNARARLAEAAAAGFLDRATEGSTMDTRHDTHAVNVLEYQGGEAVVHKVHVYRGDFLMPGKSSSSIYLKGVDR